MSIVEKVKGDLLSFSAVIVTILHIFMIVGGFTCVSWVNNGVPVKMFSRN